MIVKNDCRKFTEKKLIELKEAVNQFDNLFDKIARAGLPSCWGLRGSLLSWDSYKPLLVLEKSEVDNTHEKTQFVNGATVINFLQRHFQLLWLVKTLFAERPYFNRITTFKLEYHKLVHSPNTNIEIWKKCRAWMTYLPKDPSTSKKDKPTSQGNVATSSSIHIQHIDYNFNFILFSSFKENEIVIRHFEDM